MKVLIIPSWYTTEDNPLAGVFFKEYAESLVRYGHDVAVMYVDIRRKQKREARGISVELVNGVKEFRYNGTNYTPGFARGVNWQKCFHAKKIMKTVEDQFGIPDAIHLESCDAVHIAKRAADKWGIPFVYTEHLSNLVAGDPSRYYSRLFRKALSFSGACVAISKLFLDKMNQFPEAQTCYIPNGIDVDRLPLSKTDKVFKVKALGAMRSIKGYDILIRAFSLFARGKSDVQLVLGGDGAERESLEMLADSLSCSKKIIFAGSIQREKVPHFYEDCAVFVCSSLTETFSIVTAEALCSGVPVVATKCGGPEDMIDKTNGLLVDVGNPEQMAAALNVLYHNLDSYDRCHIRENAQSCFSYKKIVNQYEVLYQRLKHGY